MFLFPNSVSVSVWTSSRFPGRERKYFLWNECPNHIGFTWLYSFSNPNHFGHGDYNNYYGQIIRIPKYQKLLMIWLDYLLFIISREIVFMFLLNRRDIKNRRAVWEADERNKLIRPDKLKLFIFWYWIQYLN